MLLIYLAAVVTVVTGELRRLTRQSIEAQVVTAAQVTRTRDDLRDAQMIQVRLLQTICFNTTTDPKQAERCLTSPRTVEPFPRAEKKSAAAPKAATGEDRGEGKPVEKPWWKTLWPSWLDSGGMP